MSLLRLVLTEGVFHVLSFENAFLGVLNSPSIINEGYHFLLTLFKTYHFPILSVSTHLDVRKGLVRFSTEHLTFKSWAFSGAQNADASEAVQMDLWTDRQTIPGAFCPFAKMFLNLNSGIRCYKVNSFVEVTSV